METIEVREGLPGGGWHTIRRVLMPAGGVWRMTCPNCGNDDQDKFKTHASGATLKGYLCMNCKLPRQGG